MEPAPSTLVYIFYDEVAEVTPDRWFSLVQLPNHFICLAEFLSRGDKVKVTIQKVPQDDPVRNPVSEDQH